MWGVRRAALHGGAGSCAVHVQYPLLEPSVPSREAEGQLVVLVFGRQPLLALPFEVAAHHLVRVRARVIRLGVTRLGLGSGVGLGLGLRLGLRLRLRLALMCPRITSFSCFHTTRPSANVLHTISRSACRSSTY